jgi:glutamine cyclotransferase
MDKFMKRQNKLIIGTVLTVVIITITFALFSNNSFTPNGTPNETIGPEIIYYTYQIVKTYPHNESAFTQGLVYEDGTLYEGTGLYRQSTIRQVDLETGNVTQIYSLPAHFFGEGITIFENKIIQLTWKNNIGFVYNKENFELLQQFNYFTEGWGLTNNSSALIMSDGTATLHFLDPQTFQIINQIVVYDEKGPVTRLNELEYINGSIYANIWLEDTIAIINPQSGNVTGWIDLSGLKDLMNSTTSDNVLNGIAYDSNKNRLFVTGKNWSKLFEIKLVEEN